MMYARNRWLCVLLLLTLLLTSLPAPLSAEETIGRV